MMKDTIEGYDLAWTILKSIQNNGRYFNLLPISSKILRCKMKVKNIDGDDPWIAIPLRRTLWVRDPDAQKIYADYIRNIDPDLAIQYYQKSARCGNLNSAEKLKELYESGFEPQDVSPSELKIEYLKKRIEEEKDSRQRNKLINLRKYLESDIEVTLRTLGQNDKVIKSNEIPDE